MINQERIKEILRLDNMNQHLKHYQEGYRESMLTQIYEEDKVWSNFEIDVDRYLPGSARRFSYDQGWNDAISDYSLK